jgi:hypothetical protein
MILNTSGYWVLNFSDIWYLKEQVGGGHTSVGSVKKSYFFSQNHEIVREICAL